MEVSYLYKEKFPLKYSKESKIKCVNIEDKLQVVIFNKGRELLFVKRPPRKQNEQIHISSSNSKEDLKKSFNFLNKLDSTGRIFVKFSHEINDFDVDNSASKDIMTFVLTANGLISFLSIGKIIDSLMLSEKNMDNNDPVEVRLDNCLIGSPTNVVRHLLNIQFGRTYFYFMRNLCIFHLEREFLKIYRIDILQGSNNLQLIVSHQLFDSSISKTNSFLPLKLFFLPCEKKCSYGGIESYQVPISSGDSITCTHLNCLLFVGLSDGNILNICSGGCSRGKDVNLVYDLKQELFHVSYHTVNDVRNENNHTIYEPTERVEVEKSLKCFKGNKLNNILLFLGKQGKLSLLLKHKGLSKQTKQNYDYQFSLPISSCSLYNDFLFVSDMKVINIFKIFITVRVKKDYINNKEITNVIFIPEHELVHTVQLSNIITMKILNTNPFVICCLNYKKHILLVDVTNNEIDGKKRGNLDELMKKLEITQTNLNEEKQNSKMVTSTLKQLKTMTALCHKINLDIRTKSQIIYHKGSQKLLISVKLSNKMTFKITGSWYLLTICYQRFSSMLPYPNKVKSSTECFSLPELNSGTSVDFQFLVNPSDFMNYSELVVDFYMSASFKASFNPSLVERNNTNGICLYFKTLNMNIFDRCKIVDSMYKSTLLGSSKESHRESCFSSSGYSCSLLITPFELNQIQNKSKIVINMKQDADSIAPVLYKYLLGLVDLTCRNIIAIRLGDDTMEFKIEKNGNSFDLHFKSFSISLLAASHHTVFHKLNFSHFNQSELKDKIVSRLCALREFKVLHKSLKTFIDELDQNGSNKMTRTLLKTYLDLRDSIK